MSEAERGPVKVELVVRKDDQGPTFGQKLLRLVSIGLAGGAVTAAVGSLVARYVMPLGMEVAEKCEPFVDTAVDTFTTKLLLVQGALLGGGFLLFFLVGMFIPRKRR